jgi:hypothetical protein
MMKGLNLEQINIDNIIDIVLTDEYLLNYVSLLIKRRLPAQSNMLDKQSRINIVDQSINQAFEDIQIEALLQELIRQSRGSAPASRPTIRPNFSPSEPLPVSSHTARRVVKSMNRSRSAEAMLGGTRDRVASVDSEASTVRIISTSSNGSAPVITMQKLLNLQSNDEHMDVDLKSDSTISTASDDALFEHADQEGSERGQGTEEGMGRQSTEKLRREVDEYMNQWEQHALTEGLRPLTDLVNEPSVTSMYSWEKRIRDRLDGNVDSEGDDDFEIPNPPADRLDRGGLNESSTISPIKDEYLSSPTSLNGKLFFFDQSRFDADADYAVAAVGVDEADGKDRGRRSRRKSNTDRRVQFAHNLVNDVKYRDYCESAEKPVLFYTHYEEQRFKMDHSRELEQADALGLSWTEWMELRTDEDVALDEENDAAEMYADDSQFDYDDVEVEFDNDDGDYRPIDLLGKTYIGRSYDDLGDDF